MTMRTRTDTGITTTNKNFRFSILRLGSVQVLDFRFNLKLLNFVLFVTFVVKCLFLLWFVRWDKEFDACENL